MWQFESFFTYCKYATKDMPLIPNKLTLNWVKVPSNLRAEIEDRNPV